MYTVAGELNESLSSGSIYDLSWYFEVAVSKCNLVCLYSCIKWVFLYTWWAVWHHNSPVITYWHESTTSQWIYDVTLHLCDIREDVYDIRVQLCMTSKWTYSRFHHSGSNDITVVLSDIISSSALHRSGSLFRLYFDITNYIYTHRHTLSLWPGL